MYQRAFKPRPEWNDIQWYSPKHSRAIRTELIAAFAVVDAILPAGINIDIPVTSDESVKEGWES